MDSTGSGERKDDGSRTSMKLRDYIPIYIPTVEKGLLDHSRRKRRFLDFLKARPSKDWFLRFGFVGRLSPLRNDGSQRNGPPASDPPLAAAGGGGRRRFRVPFVRKINREALIRYWKNWIKHPMHMALLVWLFFVAAGLVMLFLLMTGLLNSTITKSSERDRWTEIVNQILNALFTILCLYEHPMLFHHSVLLWRWRSSDIVELRKVYCKNEARRPYERAQIMFVVLLLHITCFAQYALCALYWAYTSKERPDWADTFLIVLGIAAPIIAFLYTVYSPLGRKYELDTDEESQRQVAMATKPDQNELKLYNRRVVVTRPEWVGGLFDCSDDLTVSYLSFFCTFFVFGWNMERLGFGNMYVHIVTFILLVIAPFWVFYIASLNITDDTLKYVVRITGIVLCFFGLLYGGFWRTQMRKRFKLPANPFCCGYPAVTDFMQWLFCWPCSLAQEVRTGNFYDIEDDSVYRREAEEDSRLALAPLPREAGAGPLIRSSFESSLRSHSRPERSGETSLADSMETAGVDGELPTSWEAQMMTPPLPPLIQLEDKQQAKS